MAESFKLGIVNFKKSSYITIEGNNNKEQFYIIADGQVRIQRSIDLANIAETDNLLVKGDYFSVIETMSSHKIMDTVDAYTDVRLIVVNKGQFIDFAKKHPSVVRGFLTHFSKKLTFFNDLISKQSNAQSSSEKTNSEKNTEKIFDIAEYYFGKKQYNQALYSYVKYIAYEPNGVNVKLAKERISRITPIAKNAMNIQNKGSSMIKTYKDGTMLCCDHEPGNEAFIIQKGKVTITKIDEGRENVLAVVDEGNIVGEMSLLLGVPRGANMVANGDVTVLAVDKDNFDMMVKNQPEMAKKLLELFADRIWKSYRKLSNMVLKEPLAKLWDMLLVELETKRVNTNTRGAYTFDFGPKELVKMVGFDDKEGRKLIKEMLNGKKMSIQEEKIYIPSLKDLEDEVKFYRGKEERDNRIKMDKLKRGNV